MTGHEDLHARNARLLELFKTHLGVTASSLDKAVARAGRRLPSAMRRKAALLVQAEAQAGNPKLLPQLDLSSLDMAYRDLRRHLEAIDLKSQRRTRQLNTLAGLAINLLIVLAAFLFWAWWHAQP